MTTVVAAPKSMINCFGLPKAVIIHCGGKDKGSMSTGSLLFSFQMFIVHD
jgi:hypothetical protein